MWRSFRDITPFSIGDYNGMNDDIIEKNLKELFCGYSFDSSRQEEFNVYSQYIFAENRSLDKSVQLKKKILFLNQNICCGCSKEPSR